MKNTCYRNRRTLRQKSPEREESFEDVVKTVTCYNDQNEDLSPLDLVTKRRNSGPGKEKSPELSLEG